MDESNFVARQSRRIVEKQRYAFSLIRFFVLPELMHSHDQFDAWNEKIEWFTKFHEFRELDCIDREPVVLGWNTAVASGNPHDDEGKQNSA